MINKVFFPGTFITQATAEAINRRIGRFVVYQPLMGHSPRVLETLFETSSIELRHPVIGNEKYLLELCRAYNSWGGVYQKDALRLKRLADEGFYNQSFAAEIRTEILKRKNMGESESSQDLQKTDPMVNARMFLQLSQEFDLSESEIQQSLEQADNASKRLFEQLRGETLTSGDFPGGAGGVADDASAVMTEARLAAWSLLSRNDIAPPDIFVTDSPAVMEKVTERFPSIERIGGTSAVSADAEGELVTRFQSIAKTPWPGSRKAREMLSYLDRIAKDDFFMELYAIPDVAPEKVIESLSDTPASQENREPGGLHAFFCCVAKDRP